MVKVVNNSNNPYYNLAFEEYMLKQEGINSLFFIWQNEPVVVIGKNQNAYDEVDIEYLKKSDIALVRRISGGGAVYHDLGNINFTFIDLTTKGVAFDFARFTAPVIKTLDKIGIKAQHEGRNDITIAGKKFSGNAQFRQGAKVMHHGTLLYNVDLENMTNVLNVNTEKMGAKGVKSVRSRVTNISEHLDIDLSVEEFKELLIKNLQAELKIMDTIILKADDLAQITNLCNNKYMSWDWNYGKSPDYNLKRQKKFPWGLIEFRLKVDKGIINNCKIYGDFFAYEDISLLEEKFLQVEYKPRALSALLERIDITAYLPNTNKGEILDLLLGQEKG
ncbi:MAG: lipoate--protein ligase [Syntrophomonadaceae bacterium]|nr:lipoate--protein ligase [Syntrophomonadaceae bacterium]